VVNIAYDSEGRPYCGAEIKHVRQKFARCRGGLQRRGIKAAPRRLKRLSGNEAGCRAHVNHEIAKEIFAKAERAHGAIAVEDLKHIRKRVKARRAQRSRLHGGAFAELRQSTTSPARRAGSPTVAIDPRNTTGTCPECGVIDKANRKDQAIFSCMLCGCTAAGDVVAHRKIRVAGGRLSRRSLFCAFFAGDGKAPPSGRGSMTLVSPFRPVGWATAVEAPQMRHAADPPYPRGSADRVSTAGVVTRSSFRHLGQAPNLGQAPGSGISAAFAHPACCRFVLRFE
jgi:IS605 OrfB family transposase